MGLSSHLQRFIPDRRGNVAMIFAVSALPLLLVAGMPVDYMGALHARTRLQAIVDASVLAAAVQLPDAAKALSTVNAHFDHGTMDMTIVKRDFSIKDEKVVASVSAEYPTTLMNLVGVDSLEITADARATSGGAGMELVMVLDVSGSMSGEIPSLRAAATQLLDEIYGNKTSLANVHIGLAPFGGRVNVIEYGENWMTSPPAMSNGPTAPVGTTCKVKTQNVSYPRLCTTHRSLANSENDEPPSVEKFGNFAGSWEVCPVNKSVGLNASRAVIQSAVDQLCAGHGTSTEVGMVWGWRMISPKWKGLWGNPKLPLSMSDTPGKYVVIMTDGKNHPNQSGDTYSETQANDRLLRQCSAMKQSGITIFAVTFNMGGALSSLYEQCVSKSEFNFTAEDGYELKSVFGAIGEFVTAGKVRLLN